MTPLEQTLKIGLEQAAAGQTVDLGSFAQYAEDSEEAIERDIADFEATFKDGGCSCHNMPPCSYCTHPGNPISVEVRRGG